MSEKYIRYKLIRNTFFPPTIQEDLYLLGLAQNGDELQTKSTEEDTLTNYFVIKVKTVGAPEGDKKGSPLPLSKGKYRFAGEGFTTTVDGNNISYNCFEPMDANCTKDLEKGFFTNFIVV